ncbi:endo-1,4-beta-xylanase [Vibrio sp. 10N.286.51.F4]|uniref:endo-1,4-beta-xylanase n=1 Tax=Vibrio sp. 10N.286.51.F4 TaxID=3229710 RepID=UPI0035538923
MKWNSFLLIAGVAIALPGCLSESGSEVETGSPELPSTVVASLFQLSEGYPIGVALPAGDAQNSVFIRSDLQSVLGQHFNQITAENIMKPSYLQPEQGTFFFDDADRLVAFSQEIGSGLHGHTLVWHQQLPDWMKSCTTNCASVMTDHITNVANHFAGKVDSWDVVNEAFNEDGTYRNAGDQGSVWFANIGKDYIAQAFTAADQADSSADLYYNDYNIERNDAKLTAVLTMVNELKTANVPIDGIGFQMHVGLDDPSIETISASLTKAAQTGLKVKITELDVRLNPNGDYSELSLELADIQKKRFENIVTQYLAIVPEEQRGGISVWGVSDADSWIIDLYGNADWPLLFDSKLVAKPALQGFANGLISAAKPELPSLFKDSFEDGVYWYEDGSTTVTGAYTHNAADKTMNVDVEWLANGDEYVVATTFTDNETIDFSTAKTLSFDVYVPSEYGTDGHLAIQPFIMDGAYTPAYIGWQFGYQLDEWSTITIPNISPDFAFGYSGNPDFTNIDRIGLQFIANGAVLPQKTIQIDNVIIR